MFQFAVQTQPEQTQPFDHPTDDRNTLCLPLPMIKFSLTVYSYRYLTNCFNRWIEKEIQTFQRHHHYRQHPHFNTATSVAISPPFHRHFYPVATQLDNYRYQRYQRTQLCLRPSFSISTGARNDVHCVLCVSQFKLPSAQIDYTTRSINKQPTNSTFPTANTSPPFYPPP